MDYLCTTEAELGIDLDRPLSEHDPLDRLNDLENKKRKHVDDIHDFFRANKRLKSSVQYEDHPAGNVLNEPVLCMILFSSYHRQDFVTIEDFRDSPNTMLYTVQEIFFRLHQAPSASALQVLRRLGSIFTSVYAVEQKLKKDSWKELQFSLVDNSMLNIVQRVVSLLEGLQGGKKMLYVKRNKAISLGNVTSKVGIEVHQLSLKDCTWYYKACVH
ncbi:hypothetical protein Tco_1282916 [Tanacetum coccineum]